MGAGYLGGDEFGDEITVIRSVFRPEGFSYYSHPREPPNNHSFRRAGLGLWSL
jgi:hypothetical protein